MSAYTYSTPVKADRGHEFTIYKNSRPVTGAWVHGSKRGAEQEAKRMVARLENEDANGKPCPECGKQPTAEVNAAGIHEVGCNDCYDYAPDEKIKSPTGFGGTRHKAIASWNEDVERYQEQMSA